MLILGGSVTLPPATVWSRTLSNANIEFLARDRTANFRVGAWMHAYSTTSRSAGRWYFEIRIDDFRGHDGWVAGIVGNAVFGFPGSIDNPDSVGVRIAAPNGVSIWYMNTIVANGNFVCPWSPGDTLGFAFDRNSRLFWVCNVTTGSGWSDINTGTMGPGDPTTGQGGLFANLMTTSLARRFHIAGGGYSVVGPSPISRMTIQPIAVLGKGAPPAGFTWWDNLVNSTIGRSTGLGMTLARTTRINTTQANLLIAVSTGYQGGVWETEPTQDSENNTWTTAARVPSVGGQVIIRIDYVINPITSRRHQFSVVGHYSTLFISAWHMEGAAAFDKQENIYLPTAASAQVPALTPTNPNSLLLTAMGGDLSTANIASVDDNFWVVRNMPFVGPAVAQPAAWAYQVQSDPLSVSPTWVCAGAGGALTAITAVFSGV